MLALLITMLFFGLVSGSEAASVRGYVSRACGYDLDFDGVLGEAADCGLCDASGGSDEDIDGNSVADRQVYVDCDSGVDDVNCGAYDDTCATVNYAMAGTNSNFTYYIRTPDATQIQAICFKGTCDNESVTIAQSGAVGYYTRTASGSEKRDFQFPRYPLIISGWDADDDGSYPPYDTDDTSVMDGNTSGDTAWAITNISGGSRLEFAHFKAQDYALDCPTDSPYGGFAKSMVGGLVNHLYYHDIKLENILKECHANGFDHVFYGFGSGTAFSYLAFINIDVLNWASWFWRGASDNSGPIRFQNLTLISKGPLGEPVAGSYMQAFKMWGETTGIEILDSVLNANVSNWAPCDGSVVIPECYATSAVAFTQCTQDILVRNNYFLDWKSNLSVQPDGGASFCQTRNIDDVVFDGNEVRVTYDPWVYGDTGINVISGDVVGTSDITIVNNILSSAVGWQFCMELDSGCSTGCTVGGVLTVVNNTCVLDANYGFGAIILGDPQYDEVDVQQQNVVLKNNVVTGLGSGDIAMQFEYLPSNYQGDNNAYDALCTAAGNCFKKPDTSRVSLADWRTYVSDEANSVECDPTFVSSTDFHLQSGDTCAKDAGTDASAITTVDYDSQLRPAGAAWDIGADEYLACHGGS